MKNTRTVLHHLSIGVSDLERSIAFYDRVLAPLGYKRLWSDSDAAGYGATGTDEPFSIKRATSLMVSERFHIAFSAPSRSAVAAFFEAAVDAGAKPDGKAQLHPEYGENYFASFVLDLDGHRLEAVFRGTADALQYELDHVQLAMPAGQEALARAFYTQLLGFEEVPKPAPLAARGGCWFRSGAASIHLGVDADFTPARKAHPALRVSNYDEFVECLTARGIALVEDPIPFEGRRHFYIADPFGNRIEILESTSTGSPAR